MVSTHIFSHVDAWRFRFRSLSPVFFVSLIVSLTKIIWDGYKFIDICIQFCVLIVPEIQYRLETVLSPWLEADEARVSHVLSHVVWWKKKC